MRTHPRQPRRTGGCSSHNTWLLPTSQCLRQIFSLLSMKCASINKSHARRSNTLYTFRTDAARAHIIPTLVRSLADINSINAQDEN